MAACARGAKMASTAMCSERVPFSGCSACTVTSTGGVVSFLQPERRSNGSAAAPANMQSKRCDGGCADFELVVLYGSVMGLHRSCERLEIGERGLEPHPAIFAGILRCHVRGLGIDDLENRGFAACVAHLGEAEAFLRRADTGVERHQLLTGGGGLGPGFIQPRDQPSLRIGQCNFGGVPADLALLYLVLHGQPV